MKMLDLPIVYDKCPRATSDNPPRCEVQHYEDGSADVNCEGRCGVTDLCGYMIQNGCVICQMLEQPMGDRVMQFGLLQIPRTVWLRLTEAEKLIAGLVLLELDRAEVKRDDCIARAFWDLDEHDDDLLQKMLDQAVGCINKKLNGYAQIEKHSGGFRTSTKTTLT